MRRGIQQRWAVTGEVTCASEETTCAVNNLSSQATELSGTARQQLPDQAVGRILEGSVVRVSKGQHDGFDFHTRISC